MKADVIIKFPRGPEYSIHPQVIFNGSTLQVLLQDRKSDRAFRYDFLRVGALRFSNELHTRDILDGCLDKICVLADSPWRSELCKLHAHSPLLTADHAKHYLVYITDFGYLEVIANGIKVVD